MKVFVAGGTGIIGNLLIPELLSKGYEVSIVSRNQSRMRHLWKYRVNIYEGDLTKKDQDWTEQVKGHDAIINLIGENIFSKRWSKKRKDKLYDSRINSNQNLSNAIKNLDDPPKIWISPSGSDYYPPHESKEFVETDEPGDHFLGTLCRDWEAPMQALENTEVRIVIFRFGPAFTTTGKTAERMFVPHRLFIGGWIGSGKQWMPWIHQNDFVGVIIWALEKEVAGVFNAAAPDYKTMKQLAKIGGKVLGRWTWTWVPGFALKLLLGSRASILLEGRKLSPNKLIEAGYQFQFPNAEHALQDILLKKN